MTFFLSHQISLSKNYCRPVKNLFKVGNTSCLLQVSCITINQNLITIYVKNDQNHFPLHSFHHIQHCLLSGSDFCGNNEEKSTIGNGRNATKVPSGIKSTGQTTCNKNYTAATSLSGFFQFEIRLNMVCKSSFSGYI